jgi:hypothetical protein
MPAGWAAAAAAVVGGISSASSSRRAAKSQQKATDAAIGEQQRQYDLARSDQRIYRETGGQALQALASELGLAGLAGKRAETREEIRARLAPEFTWAGYGGNGVDDAGLDLATQEELDYQKAQGYGTGVAPTPGARPDYVAEALREPGYQFGLQQGQQALDRKIAAMGGRVSGAALKAAARYGTDYASTGYNAAYQRGQDRLNRLAALAGLGQTGTQASAQSGANSANAISNLMSSQGNANAAATMAQGNIWGNAANQLAGYYMNQQQQPRNHFGLSYSPGAGYGSGYSGSYVNQGPSGGDAGGSYWGVE